MPTTYSHDIFGKDVFKRLPKPLKETIKDGKSLYRIGLHGPDIFFYYRPITKNELTTLGNRMHAEIAAPFFHDAVKEYKRNPSSQLASYLLGFVCHYVLDSTCHGYIGEYEEKTGASHAEIETELDRYLMKREHKKLHEYLPASVLNPSPSNCKIIARLFPEIGAKRIRKTIKSMKYYDQLLTCQTAVKEKVVLGGMKVLGCYKSMQGQVMRREPLENCIESTKHLILLYDKAVEEAPKVLENMYNCLVGDERLSDRFNRNFE